MALSSMETTFMLLTIINWHEQEFIIHFPNFCHFFDIFQPILVVVLEPGAAGHVCREQVRVIGNALCFIPLLWDNANYLSSFLV